MNNTRLEKKYCSNLPILGRFKIHDVVILRYMNTENLTWHQHGNLNSPIHVRKHNYFIMGENWFSFYILIMSKLAYYSNKL